MSQITGKVSVHHVFPPFILPHNTQEGVLANSHRARLLFYYHLFLMFKTVCSLALSPLRRCVACPGSGSDW